MNRLADLIKGLPLIRHLLRIDANLEEAHRQLRMLRELAIEDYIENRLLTLPKYHSPTRLNRYEKQVYSQGGEDGMLAEIFTRIGTTNCFLVEFGVGDGLKNSNSVYWLSQGWRGCWIEANAALVQKIKRRFATQISNEKLAVKHTRVTPENIGALFTAMNVPEDFDLLSIDIDGNDYWVWKALRQFKPRVVVIEYNALFPPPLRWVMKYKDSFVWDGTSHFGASLKSLELLGTSKGYNLVGCTLSGLNAFFVRADLCKDRFAEPYTAENHYEPPRYFLLRQVGYRRAFGEFENI